MRVGVEHDGAQPGVAGDLLGMIDQGSADPAPLVGLIDGDALEQQHRVLQLQHEHAHHAVMVRRHPDVAGPDRASVGAHRRLAADPLMWGGRRL